MSIAEEREIVLLRATLREIIRIADASERSPTSVSINDALDGRLAREWQNIVTRARGIMT